MNSSTPSKIDTYLHTLQTNQDAVERFLALYDLYKLITKGRPTVADASRIDQAMRHTADEDRDLNVRAWAEYFHGRVWGEQTAAVRPYLPKIWKLLVVEEI